MRTDDLSVGAVECHSFAGLLAGRSAGMLLTHRIDLWQAEFAALRAYVPRLSVLLSPEESERRDRFVVKEAAERFVVSRGVLRSLLGGYLKCPPRRIILVRSPTGKPKLVEPTRGLDVEFSVSHSGDRLVVAITQGEEIGVDVEWKEPPRDFLAIAEKYFPRGEVEALKRMPLAAFRAAFFRCWTRSEALSKADGRGIRLISFAHPGSGGLGEGILTVEVEGQPFTVADLDVGGGYAGAVAVAGRSIAPRVWRTIR